MCLIIILWDPVLLMIFSDKQMATFISLIMENSINGKGVHANMAGANQHMTYTDTNLVNFIDVSYLKIKGKQTREPFLLSDHVSTEFGELVHLDLWGPYKVTSRDGFKLPTSVLNGKSPHDLVYNKPPSLKHLRSFGCFAYATILNIHDKFGSGSEECVLFFEDIFPFKQNVSSTIDNYVQDVNDLNFFNTNSLDDLHDIPNDEERMNPSPKRHDTPLSHSSSPSTSSNENDGEHFQDANAFASDSERSADLEENIVNSEGDDLQDHP
ncbi:hypothetical protein Tco_0988190 [Tanacetum coccineum]|uniref:Uncharacterized protein n=1 Tax=Tanacetum coccineum TaxID=301880 RepID=A0ABQ5EQ78_9ASTR